MSTHLSCVYPPDAEGPAASALRRAAHCTSGKLHTAEDDERQSI